jgi:hypothetical protein
MVLNPGDSVEKDVCDQVGNFPHGLLSNPDALDLSPNAFGPTLALNSRKQDYIDAFDANDLTICNEDQFATLHTPYIAFLERKDDEEPPDDTIGKDRCIRIYAYIGDYNVQSVGPWTFAGSKRSSWDYFVYQATQGHSDVLREAAYGSVTFDFMQLGVFNYAEVLGGWYDNNTFIGTAEVAWAVTHINDPTTAEIQITSTLTLTCANDGGIITGFKTLTSQKGWLSHTLQHKINDSVSWSYMNQVGTLLKTIDFYYHIAVVNKTSVGYDGDIDPF